MNRAACGWSRGKKATGRPFVSFTDVVDEALCFGWVDSKINKLDEERAMRLFTPRNPKSPWSRINKAKVARLVDQGRMGAAGMRLVEGAKKDGSWNIYDEIEGTGDTSRFGVRIGG